MSWFRWIAGDPMLVDPQLAELAQALCDTERDLAIALRHESGALHCNVVIYFSPGLQALASRYGGHPCPPPSRRGLSLLAGDASLLQQLPA